MPGTMTYAQALNDTLRREMRRDDSVVVLGEDVGLYGGVFGVTDGLRDEFGADRVVDTPISENGIVGAAVGMALGGLRPVVEIMYNDFLCLALDSLANAAAVFPFVSRGRARVPLVVRTQGGPGGSAGPQHSKSLEQWTAHLPGLHTVAPSTPADAKGLLASAIRCDEPVVFFENKNLYRVEGTVPDGDHLTPLGTARVARPGRDVTVIALSGAVAHALQAARTLSTAGIEAEVIDVRSLRPLDCAPLIDSARRTGRVVVASEGWVRYGPTAEIAAAVSEGAFTALRAPVVRVGALAVPLPAGPTLEAAVLSGPDRIATAVRQVTHSAAAGPDPGSGPAPDGARWSR